MAGLASHRIMPYAASNGFVVINAPGDRHFHGDPRRHRPPRPLKADPRFSTRSSRVTHMADVDDLLESWTREHTKEDIAERLLAVAVPCAPVRELSEVVLDENMHARGSLQWGRPPDMGRVVLPHTPLNFEGTPRIPIEPSHKLGADKRQSLWWTGLDIPMKN